MTAEVLIIGGGIVGLACAAENAKKNRSTLLIERHDSFGQETSSRNSEVVHSGIYYPTGSLKARLCVAGNVTTYEDCERFGVWYKRCTKLIVAVTEEEEPELEKLYQRGIANGVEGLNIIDRKKVQELEPHIECRSAIFLPTTGIVDSHELMKGYLHEATSLGADVAFRVEFLSGELQSGQYRVRVKDAGGSEMEISTNKVVNAAGLFSDTVAQSFGIDIDAAGYRLHPNRGHYYSVSSAKSKLVSRLVYPMPQKNLVGTGIHITLDKAGQCKLGPDAEFIDSSVPQSDWYHFDDTRREKFYSSVKRYFPRLEREDLSPNQVGVRPKRVGSDDSVKDFIIHEESAKGLPGLVNLIGIESPGLTCAHEIAREVFRLLKD